MGGLPTFAEAKVKGEVAPTSVVALAAALDNKRT